LTPWWSIAPGSSCCPRRRRTGSPDADLGVVAEHRARTRHAEAKTHRLVGADLDAVVEHGDRTRHAARGEGAPARRTPISASWRSTAPGPVMLPEAKTHRPAGADLDAVAEHGARTRHAARGEGAGA
jgi:hypothetical protein